ncbi:MAG: KTSC domain-containing protein [Acidobacteriota bacterium]|nr:KTSC domain-containing protein [Acidobacteriota bacterium]
MDWLKLDSKMLASVAYDPNKQILYLRFRTGEVYRYFEFSAEDYQNFLNAESRGKYFLANIRDQFRYERLAKLRVA